VGAGFPAAAVGVQAAGAPGAVEGVLDICGNGTGTGKITGRVTRASNGAPIEGIRVFVTTLFDDDLSFGLLDLTAADGSYELTGLAGGTYVVRTDASAFNAANPDAPALVPEVYEEQATVATFTPVQVVDGQTVPNINFTLSEGGTIRGRITNRATGLPEDGEVTLHRADTELPRVAATLLAIGGTGNYTFTVGLPPGSYKIGYRSTRVEMDTVFYPNTTDFAAAETIEIAGSETKTINLAATIPAPLVLPQGQVRGKVTLAGGGNLRDIVRVRGFVGDDMVPRASASTDAAGLYTMTVPAGTVKVMIEPGVGTETGPNSREYIRKFFNNKKTLAEAQSVSVPANGVVNNVDFALERGGRMSGRVTFTDGTPVSGVTIAAFTGPSANSTVQSASTQTNDTGEYQLTALASGVYTVAVRLVSTALGCTYPQQKKIVTVASPNPLPNIDFTLAPGAYITGRVTSAESGAGVRSVVRALLPGESEESFGVSTLSAQTGYYRVGPLLPGEYQLLFLPAQSTGLGQIYFGGTTDRSRAQKFRVAGAQVVGGTDIALRPGAVAPEGPVKVYLPALWR
jgi:hypothetical protein